MGRQFVGMLLVGVGLGAWSCGTHDSDSTGSDGLAGSGGSVSGIGGLGSGVGGSVSGIGGSENGVGGLESGIGGLESGVGGSGIGGDQGLGGAGVGGSGVGGRLGSGGDFGSGGSGVGGGLGSGGDFGSGGSGVGGNLGSGGSGIGGDVGSGGDLGSGGDFGSGGSGVGGDLSSGGSGVGGDQGSGGDQGVGGDQGTGGDEGTGGDGTGGDPPIIGPCDIYESANTPCVGAWSMTRALYGDYSGPVYQVRRTSDNATMDIPLLTPGGIADSSVQDAFCPGDCTISRLYDQSPQGNDLAISGPVWHMPNGGVESDAKLLPTTVGGYPVYGLVFTPANPPEEPGNSYRNHSPVGTATGDQAEALYEVVDSTIYNGLCCNSFGNAETTGNPDGPKTMEAIYWGNCAFFGGGSGNGPWVLADLEAGTFPSNLQYDDSVSPLIVPAFATLMLKGFSGDRFALKGGDAQTGPLITKWDGPRPTIVFEGETVHYTPMEKQGAIVLGSGGDGSTWSAGSFFEGAMTIGCPDDDSVDDAIQANIVAAGYGS